ncbi:MAG: hypothetical protein RLZ55_1251 [Actinomycetota bacterium]
MRTAVRGLGEVLITLGLILLLFVAYTIWWTTFLSHRAAAAEADGLRNSWSASATPTPTPAPTGASAAPVAPSPEPSASTGQAFALMTIPRLGNNMKSAPVLQGVSLDELAKGVGHYPDSAMPGETGNFAVAAHRITYGEPLRHVDELQVGDNVYVETAGGWYTYRLIKTQLVLPDEVWTVAPKPFPNDPSFPTKLVTLTTCDPEYGNSHRWIWWGELVAAQAKPTPAPQLKVSG